MPCDSVKGTDMVVSDQLYAEFTSSDQRLLYKNVGQPLSWNGCYLFIGKRMDIFYLIQIKPLTIWLNFCYWFFPISLAYYGNGVWVKPNL